MLPHNPSKIYTASFDPRLQHKINELRLKLHPSAKQILPESNQLGFTSFEVALLILQEHKRTDVKVYVTKGEENFYVPIDNWIGLSESIASSQSVMAVAIAAHEIGHALQSKAEKKINNYIGKEYIIWFNLFHHDFLQFRLTVMMLIAIIAIKKISPVEIVNIELPNTYFNTIQLIALTPLFVCYELFNNMAKIYNEFDASVRAIYLLKHYKILDRQQLKVARKFLIAAGLTYVVKRRQSTTYCDSN
jgi:Zn-dependent membrane protease YugP